MSLTKAIILSRRHPAMSRPEFFDYLGNIHAPLVLREAEFLSALRRYTQNHARIQGDGISLKSSFRWAQEYDSVIELWFDTAQSLANALSRPRYLEIVRPDEAKFNDFSKLIVHLTGEKIVFADAGELPRLKYFQFLKRRIGMDRPTFVAQCAAFGRRLSDERNFRQRVARFSYNFSVVAETANFAPDGGYDAISECWLKDAKAFAELKGLMPNVTESFCDDERCFSIAAEDFLIHEDETFQDAGKM